VAADASIIGETLKTAATEWPGSAHVTVELSTFEYGELYDQIAVAAAGFAEPFDVVLIDDPWLPYFASRGALLSLDDMAKSLGFGPASSGGFIPAVAALSVYKQRIFAIPYVGNSQLFASLNNVPGCRDFPEPPGSWEEVLARAEQVDSCRQQKRSATYGYAMRAREGNDIVADFLPLLWGFGGKLFEEAAGPEMPGRVAVDLPEGVRAVSLLKKLLRTAPRSLAFGGDYEVFNYIVQREAAMAVQWFAWLPSLQRAGALDGASRMIVSPLPGSVQPTMGSWLLAVSSNSRNADAAKQFVRWVTDPAQMIVAAERGNPSPLTAVLKRQAAMYRAQAGTNGKHWTDYQQDALTRARTRDRLPAWREVEQVFGRDLWEIVTSADDDVEPRLKRAAQDLDLTLVCSKCHRGVQALRTHHPRYWKQRLKFAEETSTVLQSGRVDGSQRP
jgi:multiple sugar transport system substrate-binding protein